MNDSRQVEAEIPSTLWTKMMDTAQSVVVVMDDRYRVVFWNRRAEEVFGRPPHEAIGAPLPEIIVEPDRKAVLEDMLLDTLSTGAGPASGHHLELPGRRRNGEAFPLGFNAAAVRDDDGDIWLIAFMADITARTAEKEHLRTTVRNLQDAQNQLLQAEKLASIGQLAAGVAHEINNPVGYVYSNLGSLRQYVDDLFRLLDASAEIEAHVSADSPALLSLHALRKRIDVDFLRRDMADLVDESLEGVTRVKHIVQDLKDFSRVDEAEWQWADLHRGLDSTLNIVHNEIKYKVDVIREYGDLPQIECLASQLNQVFMNLLVNAAHAIEKRGTITIRTGTGDEGGIWIEIRDTGKGIPKEQINRIFDPFFTTKPVGQGTGLGLSLAWSIVGKHHGRIEAESEPGKGTTFRIRLPVSQPEAKAER